MAQVPTLHRNRSQRRQGRSGDALRLAVARGPGPAADAAEARDSSVRRLPSALGQAALLEWLGQPAIAFHRVYVDIAGGVLPALWLSHAMNRVATAHALAFEPNGDFVFTMSASECEDATGITRAQQAGCRKQLIRQGLMLEQAEQRRATVYRLHLDRIARCLLAQAAPLAERLQAYPVLPEPAADAAPHQQVA